MIHTARFDIERSHQEEFDRWYAAEHVPRMLERPGWEAARIYACLDGEPRGLAIYDLSERALEQAEVCEAPFRDYAADHRIRNYHARTLRRISASGADPREAPLINYVTVDVAAEHAQDFSAWYDEVHVPEILGCPGWLGNERYESVDGDPRFLAVYGLSDAERPFHTPEYEGAVGWDEHVGRIRGYHGFRIYELTATVGA